MQRKPNFALAASKSTLGGRCSRGHWPSTRLSAGGGSTASKKSVDTNRTMQRFTPRKTKSHWSKVNVAKVAVLEAAGRMQDPGRAAFALRTEANTGQMSFERETVPLSTEFAARLAEASASAEWHAEQPPGYRRAAEDWVMSAKQEATRGRRLGVLIESAEQGLRVPPLRR
ncbi:hypothetical protein DFH07DRAFT_831589 [Mycena maculata]|uniref:Uncharacterized protein n=1 Tax=Mycena maculata TaxID=230809 RepID=A0AAD7IMX3_9AGAR|nr:hypothetical protein DFH07DRAFT_831589 [Mycena maculata]